MRLPLHFLLPAVRGIPVLMYHKVSGGGRDRLTIDPGLLQDHFAYLRDHGFTALSLQEFLDMARGKTTARRGAFLLTFDDGYSSHYTHVYPLIRQFDFKATFFIIGNTLDNVLPVEAGDDRKMSVADLKMMDPDVIQLALHSYRHLNFSAANLHDIQSDLKQNIAMMDASGLTYHKVLAYPYGARPAVQDFAELREWMQQHNLDAAFRIGNKPQRLPAADFFNICRIDIWGTDSVRDLSIKLKKGKLKPF